LKEPEKIFTTQTNVVNTLAMSAVLRDGS